MIFIIAAFFLGFNSHAGGASLVGDGGHVVTCDRNTDLFDIYEYRLINNPNAQITLGQGKNADLNEMAMTGILRMKVKFELSETEFFPVKRALKVLLASHNNPWFKNHTNIAFEATELRTQKIVNRQIVKDNCHVSTVVIKPPKNLDPYGDFADLCKRNFSELEYCFLVDFDYYSNLDPQQRACLIVHETIRFLPKEKAPLDERALRMTTAQICTE